MLMLKSSLLQNILEEKLQGLSAELQVRKVATSDQQKLHKKMASIKSENVSFTMYMRN